MPSPPPGVDLHGFVEDVRPLYEASIIVVVPLPIPAGTNFKVLEALAMKRPVVSTTAGCAGLGLDPGRSVLIADEPQGFAHAVLRLLENADLRGRLAEAGRRFVEERYNWDTLAEKQLALYEELAAAK
jgi:glycosyltransferase involved in cell wall biosynthesis